MPRPPADLRTWARIGAQQRLAQLEQERQAIMRTFPELRRGPQPRRAESTEAGAPARGRRRRRGPMSAAQKRAISQRMKRIWAERKKKQG